MSMIPFDPKLLIVTFNGVQITGFAEGSFVEAEQNEDSILMQVGSDGEVARAINRNESGKVKLTLQQHSRSNDYLTLQHQLDRNGLGSGDLMVKDFSGQTVLHSEEAWIVKPPTTTFSKENSTREWTLECGRLAMFVGGRI